MKTYLVTGGAGFIGSHLVEKLLNQGNKIINIDNFDDFYSYKIKCKNILESVGKNDFLMGDNKSETIQNLISTINNNQYKLHCIDIRNLDELEKVFSANKIDAIIHLAALAGVQPSIENSIDYAQVNLSGTINLWELAKKHHIKKFINASSSSVYGNNKKTPFSEIDLVNEPISPYASTKRATEILGHTYFHLHKIDMIHLRFFTVYGPRQRPDLAIHKFAKLIFENKEIPFYGDGTTARDYTFIDDIIDGIIKSLSYLENNKNVYEIINLGENEVITLKQMVSILENKLKLQAKINNLPMQPGDVIRTNANISKAKQLINYQPKTSFSLGVEKFIRWFKNENTNE
jgi:UDP-glucuronate 4-epimerase